MIFLKHKHTSTGIISSRYTLSQQVKYKHVFTTSSDSTYKCTLNTKQINIYAGSRDKCEPIHQFKIKPSVLYLLYMAVCIIAKYKKISLFKFVFHCI